MNKTVSFILGFVVGAAGGSAATYYIYKNIKDKEMEEHEADMDAYYEERLQKELEKAKKPRTIKTVPEKLPEEKNEENFVERDDEIIANNKGVKKYHHENGLESAYGSHHIFGTNDNKPEKRKESKLINEISEQEFLNSENGYEKQTVDVFMATDDDEPSICGLWAYETDNEELVEERFGKPISHLLNGRTYDELKTYCHEGDEENDDGIGVLYLKNDELKIDFEFVLHDDKEE